MEKQHDELIVLDFDHTVFNTTRFVEVLQQRLEGDFGIGKQEFHKQRDAVKQCCVVVDIATFVSRLPHDDKTGLRAAIYDVIETNAREFTFDDARPFVERHDKLFDLLLLTHGDEELQTAKIKFSGLPDRIPYLITKHEKDSALDQYMVIMYDRVHFIDDKAENIDAVKERFPDTEVYFMRRPEDQPYGHMAPMCKCEHHEVKGLDFTIRPRTREGKEKAED